jgi:hypothetical protein
MKARQNTKSLERALDRLMEAERIALERIADDNSEANRSAYLEIHETVETVRSDLHRQVSLARKILKFLHLAP